MLKKISIALALLVLSNQLHARGVDIKLAEKMAEINYLTESSTFGYGGSDIGLGVFFNDADDFQLQGQILITGNPAGNNKSLQFGIGGKLLYSSLDAPNEKVGAMAVAAQLRYVIPSSTPVAFLGAIYYAPGITTFSNAENFKEFLFAIELEVTPSARAYLGYRNMEYEFGGNSVYTLDDSAHIGIKFDF